MRKAILAINPWGSVHEMAVIVSGRLHVSPDQREAFLAARVPIVAHARGASGCADFSLSPDLLDASRVNVYERWRSREDLLAYRAGGGPELDDTIPVSDADVELHHISASEARSRPTLAAVPQRGRERRHWIQLISGPSAVRLMPFPAQVCAAPGRPSRSRQSRPSLRIIGGYTIRRRNGLIAAM